MMNNLLSHVCIAILYFILLSSFQFNSADAKLKYYTSVFNVHYPSKNLCLNCHLYVATSVNWNDYYPEQQQQRPSVSGNSPNYAVPPHNDDANIKSRAYQIDENLYTANITFSSDKVRESHVVSIYYSTVSSNSSDKVWLRNNCRVALGTGGVVNKGNQYTLTLESINMAVYHLYPYFCESKGQMRAMSVNTGSSLLGNIRTIHYYVPASLIENPIPREVNYLLQLNGLNSEDYTKTTYDFSIEQGLIPETIIFGPDEGFSDVSINDNDPWDTAINQQYYDLTPYPCISGSGRGGEAIGIECRNKSGGGFDFLDVLINSGMHGIMNELDLPLVGRDMVSVAGHSFGGLSACVYAYVNSSLFSKAYCGSPALWYNDNMFAKMVATNSPSYKIKLFIDVGMREHPIISNSVTAGYRALLDKKDSFALGSNLMYLNYDNAPDSHQWNSWIKHYPIALSFLYNDGQDIASTRTPLNRNIAFQESSRPFAIGTRFKVSTLSLQQEMGANPYQ